MRLLVISLLCAFLVEPGIHPQAPQIPPAIQKIIDKIGRGETPTAEEQKALTAFADSMAKTYGQQAPKSDDDKDEIVLTVRMKAQSESTDEYKGLGHPPNIGTEDLQHSESDRLSLEYVGETRYRVEWGEDRRPYLVETASHSSFTNSGGGEIQKRFTYYPKYGGHPCTNTTDASWTRETPGQGKRVSRGPDLVFEDRDHIVVQPFLGGCESAIKGSAFVRDECSHPNSPSEYRPNVESIMAWGPGCRELFTSAEKSGQFNENLKAKVDWKANTLASGTASHTMNITRRLEAGKYYSPDQAALRRNGTVTVSWSLMRESPDPSEVTVEVNGYESWMPYGNIDDPKEAGPGPLLITATVHKKGDRKNLREAYLKISLPYVSKNKGVCGNWPQNAGEDEGLRFREKDYPKSDGLLYKDRTHLQTDIPVEQVTFAVRSHDYGAWGTLRITATDKQGRDLKIKVTGKETPDLDIPKDEDSNRIADAWERKTTYGKGKDTDDETVSGQDARGDGVTLYDEYRGLVVLEQGKNVFGRLDPGKKQLFVIDPGGSFDSATWEKVTEIKAYKVNESLTKADAKGEIAPMVNYLSPTATGQVAYAVKIETMAGDEDPNPPLNDEGKPLPKTSHIPAEWLPGYANQAGSIKSTTYCRVFPERARKLVAYVADFVETALADPGSNAGATLRSPAAGFTSDEAKAALESLRNDSVRETVAHKILTEVAIHEVSHCAGGLPDHKAAPPAGHEAAVRGCLMFNVAEMGRLRMVIRTTLDRVNDPLPFPYVRYCRDVPVAGYSCFRKLDVKDW